MYDEKAGVKVFELKDPVEQFKDRREKVGGIQRDDFINSNQEVQDYTKNEKYRLLHEADFSPVVEPYIQEICIKGRTSSRPATEVRDMQGIVSHLSMDMDQYLEQRPVVTHDFEEDLVQDKFEQVIIKRDGKRRPPGIKKPIRKKLREREFSGCSSSEGELERVSSEESLDGDAILKDSIPVPTDIEPPASPLVVETPLGSIKDKVRALQDKVQEEEEQKNLQKAIPAAKTYFPKTETEMDMPELPRVPKSPKSPRSQTERLEETMSVKDLLKAFQTGQDPSKNKSGLFEHKSLTSLSSSISQPEGSEEIQRNEQSPLEEPKSGMGEHSAGLIQKDSNESFVIVDSASVERMVKVQESVQSLRPEEESPQLSEETLSVKELMKAFQTETNSKSGIFEHSPSASFSKHTFQSGVAEDRQEFEQSPTQEPKSQTHAQELSVLHQQEDVKAFDEANSPGEPQTLTSENTECSFYTSDSTCVGKTVRFSDTITLDDGSTRETTELSQAETVSVRELMKAFQPDQEPLKNTMDANLLKHKAIVIPDTTTLQVEPAEDTKLSPQTQEPELSRKTLGRIQLEEPVISKGISLPEDIQISPDRRPSEDFSADIKAELEESPEYQLFKQTSTASDVSYQLEPSEETLADDSVTNPESMSSPGVEHNFYEGGLSLENQVKDDNLSPESLKHEGMTESSSELEYIRTHHYSSGELEYYEGSMVSIQDTKQIRGSKEGKCTMPSEGESLHEAEITLPNDQESSEVAQVKTEEPQLQEVYIERKASSQASAGVKDIEGMLYLMTSELDQYTQSRPVVNLTTQDDVVEEIFEEIVISNDKEVEVSGTTQETHEKDKGEEMEDFTEMEVSLVEEPPMKEQWVEKQISFQSSTKVKESSGMITLLNNDLENFLKDNPVDYTSPEEDIIQEKFEEVTITKIPEFPKEEQHTICENTETVTSEDVMDTVSGESQTQSDLVNVAESNEKHWGQPTAEGTMSDMVSLLSCDLDTYLKEQPVALQSCFDETVVHEIHKQVILTKRTQKDDTEEEDKKEMYTSEIKETDLSASGINETQVQDVHTKATERDMSGMLSLLNSDLDQYLKEKTVVIQDNSEEDIVCETFKEVILTTKQPNKENLTDTPEQNITSPKDTHLESTLASDQQTCYHEEEVHKCFSSEEGEAETPPSSPLPVSTQGIMHISKSHEAIHDCRNEERDEVVAVHSILKTHKPQRPGNLENINTVVLDDPAKEPCQPDSLEASPQMEKRSSKTSPDSIEPSPTRDSPCLDSLEGSPTKSEDIDLRVPATAAVYEDYTSQLLACFDYDKNIYCKESEDEEQKNDTMCSDPNLCNSENQHILMRQDSLDKDDIADKQITPEEKMFKMAAKIKTFEEMEQEAKIKRDKSLDFSAVPETEVVSEDDNEYVNSSLRVTETEREEPEPEIKTSAALLAENEDCQDDNKGDVEADCLSVTEAEQQAKPFPGEERQTPNKSPFQTPGDERTSDPFRFQEGKLFEMTRGGAIDMTRRSIGEEGEESTFFHIGDHPVDEVVPEESGRGQTNSSSPSENTVSTNPVFQEGPPQSLTQGDNDNVPTPKPRTLFKPLSDKTHIEIPLSEADLGSSTEVQLGSPSTLEGQNVIKSEQIHLESLGLGYLDSTIADLQLDTSTFVEQGHDPSDSSPDYNDEEEEDDEEQCSVIEISSTVAKSSLPADHQDLSQVLGMEPAGRLKQEMTMEILKSCEHNVVEETAQRKSTLSRRSRSEADSELSQVSNKDARSLSDSSQPTDKTSPFPLKISDMNQQNPPTQTASSTSPQGKEIELSTMTETSIRSSLDADDISSASHKSPDSVIFAYDIPPSHSSESDNNPLLGGQPSSGTQDVFESLPAQGSMMETQVQKITDDPTPECLPGMARI